jgi:PHD/YefM family antitoxin component YafN of YafNO toxin-antitoxin module
MAQITIGAARSQLGDLVRRVSHSHETIALTDHGHVVALLVSPEAIEELEDALVLTEYKLKNALGELEPGILHAEVGRMLGLR